MKSQEEAIQEITRRLVEYYQPLKVYLFGSTTRGEGGPGRWGHAGKRPLSLAIQAAFRLHHINDLPQKWT